MPWQVPITVDGLEYPVTFNTEGEPTQQDYDEAVQQILSQKAQAAPEPEPETPGYLSQLGSALGLGYRQMKSGVGATFNALTGDMPDVAAEMAEMSKLQREQQALQTPEDLAFMRGLDEAEKAYDKASGPLETIGALAEYPAAVWNQPGAAFKTAVQSAPNALISGATSLAGYGLGGLVGGAAGIETGPGAILTGIAGAMAGGAVSNTLMEAGPAIFDVLNERTQGAASNMTADEISAYLQQNPDVVDEGMKTGAIRGSVIGAIEALGVKGSGRLLTMPERAAARAVQKELVAAGVDVASKEAVDKALLDPALRASTKAVAETAKNQFSSAGNMARLAGASAIETGAAGAGELAAQAAAGQDISTKEAFLEMMGDAALSLPMAATTKAFEGAKYMLNPALVSDLGKASAENLAATGSTAAAEAQEGFNEAIELTMLPFTREDIRATEMPFTREDIRATDLPFTREDIRATQLPFGREDIRATEMPFSREDIRGISTPAPAVEEVGDEVEPLSEGAERNRAVIAEAAAKLRGKAPKDLSAGLQAAIPQQAPQENALPVEITDESLLREKRPEMELPGVGEQNTQPEEAAAEDREEEVITPSGTPTPATEGMPTSRDVGTERDATKPEQMTPEEHLNAWNQLNIDAQKAREKANAAKAKLLPKNPASKIRQMDKNAKLEQEAITLENLRDEFPPTPSSAIENAVKEGKPFSVDLHKASGYAYIPSGYVKQGDLYVFQPGATGEPVQAAPSAAQAVKATAPGPVFQRVASEMDTMSLKDLSEYAEQQGMPRKEAVGFARDYIAKWANQIVDKANGLFGRSIKLGFFPSKISKDGMRIVASGRGLSHKHGIEVDDSQSPLHAAWVAAHEFAHQIFPTAFLPNEASLAKGDHPKGLDDIKSKSKSEKLASDFANWLVSKEYPEHSDSIPSIPSGMRDYFESLIQPQTKQAAETQTPESVAVDSGAAGVVQSEPVEGSIPTVEKVSPETESESSEKLDPKLIEAERKQAKEEEAATKQQEKLDQATKSSLNSVVGPQKKDPVQGTVTKADVETAREALTNSGEIPNAYLTNVYESREAFLADKANARLFPASYARLQTEKNIEGLYENGQTLIFAKQIQVSDLDRGLAKMLGVSDEQAAARRVIAHENGHRAISLFTMAEKRELRGYLMRAYSEEQIAKLVERYTEYADWRTNPESRFEALEELLMRDFERMEKIPTGGVWDDIVQFLKRVWRRLTGQKGEPKLKELKDVVRLMRNALKRPAVPLGSYTLKDGGQVKLSMIAPTAGITPEMDAEYLAAVEAGDMEKAQRMVDEAAKAAGFNIGPLWHGSNLVESITTFKQNMPEMSGGKRTYFTPSKKYALGYARSAKRFYLSGNILYQGSPAYKEIIARVKSGGGTFDRLSADAGFDVYSSDKGLEVSVINTNQIKSADPITYDDAGNVIPLSQRFQAASPDIRFSRPQFSSDTSATFTAGSEAARSTLYSERDMDIRESIRRAYDAIPKTNSVAVPIGELFTKTAELMPGVTQEEFSLVLQDLFEDNGAVLQEGDVVEPLTEQDRRYLALAEDEDANREELQRMVDEAAKATGLNVSGVGNGITYEVGDEPDSVYGERDNVMSHGGTFGFYFSDNPDVWSDYAKPRRKGEKGRVNRTFLSLKKPFRFSKEFVSYDELQTLLRDGGIMLPVEVKSRLDRLVAGGFGDTQPVWKWLHPTHVGAGASYGESLKKAFTDAGYDGVIHPDSSLIEGGLDTPATSYVVFSPSQIKSANPVTRDDQGRIIPLSRRFDTGADIRGQINVTTPEGKRAGFVVVMPRAAKASRIKAEGPAVSKLQENVRNIDEGSVKADFEGRQFTDTKPNQRTVKPKQSYTDAAVEFVDSLQNEGNSLEDIAYSIQSPEFIEGLGIERDLSMQDAIGLEVRNRINNALRKAKAPSVKARLNKLNLSLSKFWQGIGSVKGQHLAIRQKLIADPRYRWMFIKDKAEEAMKEARENVATANITSTDDLTNQMNREGEKADEQAAQVVADETKAAIEDDIDAQLLREGEDALDPERRKIWDRIKDILRKLALVARAKSRRVANAAKASISKAESDAIFKMSDEELAKLEKELLGEFDKLSKAFLGEESDAKTPEQKKTRAKRKKAVDVAKKRAEAGKDIETPQEGEAESSEEQVSKAERTAQAILKDLSERYSDPLIIKEKKPNVDAMRELYRERVKQGVGPNQMTEKSFVNKAVELGVGEKTAGILWKAAELEIDAREAMRQDKILQRKAAVGARADAQAHRIIFAKERLKRQSGFSGIESNANKDTIIKAFQEQVKTPISQDAFIARLRPLNVSETVAKRLFTAAEREKADLEAMEAFRMLEGPDALKNILREIERMRRGEEIPLRTPIPWRQLLSQKAKTVEEYRQRIFDAISANEAFQNLSDDKKAKLADLFSEAWESKRKDILERMLTNLINKEEAAKRISQKGAQALREQSQRLVEDINLGILDSDELMKRLAEKFGIKSEFTEEEEQKIDSLIDTLQDSTLNRVKRNKAAYDLLKTLSGTVKVPITKLLADLWVTNVLSGINTMTSIALAVSSGAFELTSGVLRIIKAAIANQKQLPSEISASFKSLARFLGAFPREANLAWQYLVTGDRAFLDPSMNDVLNDLNYDSIGKSVSLAERLAESDKLLEKTVGVWMRTVSRLLTALDSFNSGVTKSGAIPIVARQLELDPATLAKAEESMNLQNYKDIIIQRDFAGVAPKTAREKALVDSWAKDEMMADLDKYGEFTENADFFGQQGAMTLDPSGIGGMIYRLIKSVTGNLSAGSDRFLAESQRKWQERGKSDSMDATRLALAYALQFIAYNSANLAGLRFARFAGNKFNQGLSFIPGIGMLRLFEADLDKTHVKGKDAFMDMIQRNQFAGVMMSMVGLAILKAIADEPDDEKRGWAFNGGWANLTPERKQQKLAAGEKEYTIRVGDKVFNYQNWPISSVLAAIGGLSDLIRYSPEQWNEKSIAGRLGSAAASGVFAASEIPALSQFQELFGSNLSSKDPNEKKLDRFSRVMAGWGGGFVPRILKDFDFLAEPTIKKYDTLWERTASHIPVYRRYVGDDYYDILGKPIERKIYPGSREFMEKPSAPEYQILGKLNSRGIWLTPANAEHRMVGKGRNRRRLTQEEADAYSLETGKGYRQMLLRYGQRALQMPTERARAFLSDKADEVRDRALKKVYRR